MIVLRTPNRWTGPKEVDGHPAEGNWRSHLVPLAKLADSPEHMRMLEEWIRSYRLEELFYEHGRGTTRRSRPRPPDGRQSAPVDVPGHGSSEAMRVLGA
jgi:xylulose-5-phosphate/fructose-6-phosphate phosphoketolase